MPVTVRSSCSRPTVTCAGDGTDSVPLTIAASAVLERVRGGTTSHITYYGFPDFAEIQALRLAVEEALLQGR